MPRKSAVLVKASSPRNRLCVETCAADSLAVNDVFKALIRELAAVGGERRAKKMVDAIVPLMTGASTDFNPLMTAVADFLSQPGAKPAVATAFDGLAALAPGLTPCLRSCGSDGAPPLIHAIVDVILDPGVSESLKGLLAKVRDETSARRVQAGAAKRGASRKCG